MVTITSTHNLIAVFVYLFMESILIHPENAEQLKTVKAVLKALKVQFESQSSTLPSHVLEGAKESLMQHELGQSISLSEFRDKHYIKKWFLK